MHEKHLLKTRATNPRLSLGSMACLLTFSVCGSFGALASALEKEHLPNQPRKMDLDSLLTQKSDVEFSADVWKASLGKRKELLYSLVRKLPMIGMNRSEIHAFLGTPEFVDQGWEFFLLEPKWEDNLLLEIAYNGNSVLGYRIIPKKRIDRPESAQTSTRTSQWTLYVLGTDAPLFHDLKQRQKSETLLLRQAVKLQAAGKNQEALDLAEKATNQYPTDNNTELKVSLLQKLGRPKEALIALGENPVNPYNQIPYMERKIAILTELEQYKLALQTCDCLSVGSVDGKPYGQFAEAGRRRTPGASPYLLKAKLLLREGNKSQAREEAKKAFYLRNFSNRQSGEITDLLKVLGENPEESSTPSRTGNKRVLQVLAKLIHATNFSKADLESLFERKFFRLYQVGSDSDNEFNSCDGTSLFTDVVYGVEHNDTNERYLSVRFNPLLVYLTQKDLESVIGKGVFHPAGGSGCVFTPAVLRFVLPDRILTFEPGIGDNRAFLSFGMTSRKEGTEPRLLW